jgi:hypothetical protein
LLLSIWNTDTRLLPYFQRDAIFANMCHFYGKGGKSLNVCATKIRPCRYQHTHYLILTLPRSLKTSVVFSPLDTMKTVRLT